MLLFYKSYKTKNLVLFSSIRKRKKIEKSVYIFSVPWLRLERPSMGVAVYLRCFCKFTALFVFAFSELTGCHTSPLRYPMTVQEAIMKLSLVCISLLTVTCQEEMVNNIQWCFLRFINNIDFVTQFHFLGKNGEKTAPPPAPGAWDKNKNPYACQEPIDPTYELGWGSGGQLRGAGWKKTSPYSTQPPSGLPVSQIEKHNCHMYSPGLKFTISSQSLRIKSYTNYRPPGVSGFDDFFWVCFCSRLDIRFKQKKS